jgi:hypothetical protein
MHNHWSESVPQKHGFPKELNLPDWLNQQSIDSAPAENQSLVGSRTSVSGKSTAQREHVLSVLILNTLR